MSKLSEPLKALINAPHARPNTIPAPKNITSIYEKIATDAKSKHVGLPAWLCATTAATMTLNSPPSLLALHTLASNNTPTPHPDPALYTAELMREVGLKCIGFNGVPRTINCLNAFHAGLPAPLQTALAARPPRRHLTPANLPATLKRGTDLWESIYHPFSDKLAAKLAQSHPDLPVHIIESEYGALFSDPPAPDHFDPAACPNVGRVLTSVVAVACLRAQTGVGPQVLSHVFGLRKAFAEGGVGRTEGVEGGEWLAGDEGGEWLLGVVDEVVGALGGGSFAAGEGKVGRAKL